MKTTIWIAAALAVTLAGCKTEILCAAGQTLCGDHCFSTDVDAEHCGACAVRCGSHEECDAGACGCAGGATACGGACVDLVTDPAHCGSCGTVCGGSDACRADGVLGTGCAASCPGGTQPCGRACVELASDRFNCGACGTECRRGESCRAGACAADLYVACFATDDVRPVSASLRSGIPQPAGDGPIALAVEGNRVHVASSLSHSVTTFATSFRGPGYEHFLGAGDLEEVTAHDGRLYVSNSDAGTLVVMRGDTGAFVDEVVLSPRAGTNPREVAFVGDTAYVALAGKDAESGGQEIAVVDFSGPRGVVTSRIPVAALAAPGALAFPSGVVALGTKVYATTGNLKLGMFGYTDPAGPSQLAVLDTAVDPVALTTLDLGDACTNAGAVAAEGSRIWISCGGTGNVLPVDVSGGAPVVGAPVATGLWGPWKIAFCRGMGYVTDAWMGQVFRFDPTGAASPASAAVCPLVGQNPYKWAFAAGVACAP
ncbi:MAG TPA: MXAN_6577-like cysteine-rich protein [Anaeromyxobacter sp.]